MSPREDQDHPVDSEGDGVFLGKPLLRKGRGPSTTGGEGASGGGLVDGGFLCYFLLR